MGRLLSVIFPREKQPHRATTTILYDLKVGKNIVNILIWSKIYSIYVIMYSWVSQDRINGDWTIGLKEVRRGKIIVRNIGDSIMSMSKRTQKTLCVSSV